jgi:glucose-6-phosphate dehydrogenase assembly protein OpcA
MAVADHLEDIWSEQDTTPSAIEAALRKLLVEGREREEAYAPARVLNLVVIVDRAYKGEIANRLERVGRYHPSRTVLCAVDDRRTTMDAWAQMKCDALEGGIAVASEHIEIDIGPRHLEALDAIVDPLVVSDLTTMVWAPHGHESGIDALRRMSQVVLLDSAQQLHARTAITRALDLAKDVYVVDLAWLRSTPWRERIAATFDPSAFRSSLREISGITVHAREDSIVAGLLLLGWLSCRLGWQPGPLSRHGSRYAGTAHARRQDVKVVLDAAPALDVPGLAGVAIDTASGLHVSLDRGPGGLHAQRRTPDGRETHWTLLGASRGEAGILGEGIRQALLRDPTYRPALDCALTYLGDL